MKVELSQEADRDLVNILAYGAAAFGWDSAEAYVAGFERSFALLARHPEIGVLHDEFRPPIRSLPHGSHRLFYDVESGGGASLFSVCCTSPWMLVDGSVEAVSGSLRAK